MSEPPVNTSRDGSPNILIFDSGLGGLTVQAEVLRSRPDAAITYLADDAVFPYGRLAEDVLVDRVNTLMDKHIPRVRPDVVVIACNTASTLVLPHLRARFPDIPFVGTVPAIKPAAEQSRTGLISVLATPGTVARDYTRSLVESFAAHCRVQLVGSTSLASIAEACMQGDGFSDADVAAEIAPCFVDADGKRTDVIVLACTHYPLLVDAFRRLAPWPVVWIDPAPAIARRVSHLLREQGFAEAAPNAVTVTGRAIFSSGKTPGPALETALAFRKLKAT